jgi:hypothetical protein
MAIGTTNNEGLNFKTNDSLRMKIGTNGDVEVKSHLRLTGPHSLEPGILDPCAFILGVGNNGQVGLVEAVEVEATFDNGTPQGTTCPPQVYPFTWNTIGNIIPNNGRFLGTINNFDLNIRTNNIQRMVVKNNGNVGIGTTTPSQKFQVNGNTLFVGNSKITGSIEIGTNDPLDRLQVGSGFTKLAIGTAGADGLDWGSSYIGFNATRTIYNHWEIEGIGNVNGASVIYSNWGGDICFSGFPSSNGNSLTKTDLDVKNNVVMRISPTGLVGIGTDLSDQYSYMYKLNVGGGIRAKSLKIYPGWSDFVFDKNYALPTLRDVETYIATYGHLPEIPNNCEVQENGIDVGEMNAKLLQKIEELTLYLIDLQKQVDELKGGRK